MEKYMAINYMEENHINGTVTAILKHGFEYMACNGCCYYVPYSTCKH